MALPAELTREAGSWLPGVPPAMRAIPPERWHLTLAFYGESDDACVQCVQRQLARRLTGVADGVDLQLQITGSGVFHGGVAFLAVAGVRPGDEAGLRQLATQCGRAGGACDVASDAARQRFRPHITVARARGSGTVDPDFVSALRKCRPTAWTSSRVDLIASQLGSHPRYGVLESFGVPR